MGKGGVARFPRAELVACTTGMVGEKYHSFLSFVRNLRHRLSASDQVDGFFHSVVADILGEGSVSGETAVAGRVASSST
jgi:hypothetical protein